MSFFRNYPIKAYRFGDQLDPALFQNLSIYIDLIDQVKDNLDFYQPVSIIDGERPDTLSYRLYGTVDYYWTFFFLNDKLRLSGWPLTTQEVYSKAQIYYPNITLNVTMVTAFDPAASPNFSEFANFFTRGKLVKGQTSEAQGVILERNLDLGQLVIQRSNDLSFINGELLEVDFEDVVTLRRTGIRTAVDQYNSVHHWEDTSGNWVDIDPFDPPDAPYTSVLPITHLERLDAVNEDLRNIKALKPSVANQVFNEYQKLLRVNN